MSNMLKMILNWIKEVFWKIFPGRKEVKADERLPETVPKRKYYRIPETTLGKIFWLSDHHGWYLKDACKEVGVNYGSVSGMRGYHPERIAKALKVWDQHMAEHGVPSYQTRTDSDRISGGRYGATDPLLVGKVMWLVQNKNLTIKKASLLVDGVASCTVYHWRKHHPERFADAVALYKSQFPADKDPEPDPEPEPKPEPGPLKEHLLKSFKAALNSVKPKLDQNVKAKALKGFKDLSPLLETTVGEHQVWEIYLDIVQAGANPDIGTGVCKMLVYLHQNPEKAPRSASKEMKGSYGMYYGLSKDGGTASKAYSPVFAKAKKFVADKAVKPSNTSILKAREALKRKRVSAKDASVKPAVSDEEQGAALAHFIGINSEEEAELKEAKRKADLLELAPKVQKTWGRLVDACLLQMEHGLTPEEACKKAKVSFELYNKCKANNVYHRGDHFGSLAIEAEQAGLNFRLLKQQRQA